MREMHVRQEHKSALSISTMMIDDVMKLEAEKRVDDLYMKRAKFIMNSESCEFVKQLAMAENRKEHKETKKAIK
jgi:hypothetical protein